tara:strand:- start:107 stop:592 length:486 start_codon:yes stop_codon:yes gene_type:complete
MDTIELHLDNDNELLFKVVVEGTSQGAAKCRLMLEKNDYSYVFNGTLDESGEVSVSIPTMKNSLKEGSYQAHLEVLVDDRIFVPLTFNANFKQSLKVQAEAITRKPKSKMSASAAIVTSAKAQNIIVEEAPKKKAPIDISKLSRSQKKALIKMLEGKKVRK